MKKIIFIVSLIFIIFYFLFSNVNSEDQFIIIKLQKGNKTIYVNDKPIQMDVAPIEIPPGRIMVPVRFVSEGLGAYIKWDEKTETVTIISENIKYYKSLYTSTQNELNNLNNQLKEKEQKIKDLEKNNIDLNKQLKEYEEKIKNLEKNNNDLQNQIKEKDEKINALVKENNDLKNQLNEKDEKIKTLEKENNELKEKLKQYEHEEELYYVKRVIDGDTIELEDGTKVRYIGINAPELGQNFYEEAKKRNEELVLGKKVKLEKDIQIYDQYGRLLAYVFVNNIFVNLQLVKEGLAVVETTPPNVKYVDDLLKAQKYAQDNELGIWKKSKIKLKIIYINYDAPGNDNDNLNGEWVEIKNIGDSEVNMKNFVLKDLANHSFIFPDFILKPNSIVRVYTGCGTNSLTSLYWCSKSAIWNNDTDTAFLYDPNGNLIDMYKYP